MLRLAIWLTLIDSIRGLRPISGLQVLGLGLAQVIWVQADVFGLFSVSVGSFLDNLGWGRAIFSQNVGMKLRCSRADRFTFAGRYS
jgi:hypothetical protein